MSTPNARRDSVPSLGVRATVFVDEERHYPAVFPEQRTGLRRINVRPPEPHADSGDESEPLIEELEIVSHYTLHVALYALQNPTPENIAKALSKIGETGDVEEHVDHDTLLPLPVGPPPAWERP